MSLQVCWFIGYGLAKGWERKKEGKGVPQICWSELLQHRDSIYVDGQNEGRGKLMESEWEIKSLVYHLRFPLSI